MSRNKHEVAQVTSDTSPQSLSTHLSATPPKPGKLLRLPAVEELTGLKKSTIYAAVHAKTFPAPVRLSARAVAWREEQISSWAAGLSQSRAK